jgi:hypothetical protein
MPPRPPTKLLTNPLLRNKNIQHETERPCPIVDRGVFLPGAQTSIWSQKDDPKKFEIFFINVLKLL